MAMKCIGILMMITIELYILIAFISFTHSAPIMLPQFYELDKAQKPEHQEPKLPLQKKNMNIVKKAKSMEHQDFHMVIVSLMVL